MNNSKEDERNVITLKDVAQACGLKMGSVSQILQRDDSRYSQETRQRVREVAERLRYRPNAMAQGMRTGKTGIIGFLIPNRIVEHFSDKALSLRIMMGVEAEFMKAGYKVLLAAITDDEVEHLKSPPILLDGYVDGLVVLGMPSKDYLLALHRKCPRMVVADEAPEDVPAVVPDNFGGGMLAGEYAWDMGYRSFAFISRTPKSPNLEARLKGFRTAVESRAGGVLDIPTFRGNPWSEDGAIDVAKIAFAKSGNASFWFCANDFFAFHAIQVLREAGRRVPEDNAVLGFDNADFAAYSVPGLATLEVDKQMMGRECARMLLRMINGDSNATTPSRVTIPVRLIPRPSVVRKN
jgi:LacI family transcriptional regulator